MENLTPNISLHKKLLRYALRQARAARAQHNASYATNYTHHMLDLTAHTEQRVQRRLTIAAYLPVSTEPPIMPGLEKLADAGHRIIVPRVLSRGQLDWVPWSRQGRFTTNSMGIREPLGESLGQDVFHTADIRLIPALAYDSHGTRLGQGGGYYDRLLAGSPAATDSGPGPITIGVVFGREILDRLPAQEHDARIFSALTESGIKPLGPTEKGKGRAE